MKHSHQNFFEQCCEKRLRDSTTRTFSLTKTPQEISHACLFMAYLDQVCLEMASKRVVMQRDFSFVSQHRYSYSTRDIQFTFPVWIALDVPMSLSPYPVGRTQERVAALFFYNLESPALLRHALVPPICSRRWTENDPLMPTWWEWRLELIDPAGAVFDTSRFYFDQRTAQWHKMAYSPCSWNLCHSGVDPDLSSWIDPCHRCRALMKYYSCVLFALLSAQIGQPISLKNSAFEARKRRVFDQFSLIR